MANEANGLRTIMQDMHGHLDRHPAVDLAPLEKYFEHAETVAGQLEDTLAERETTINQKQHELMELQAAHSRLREKLQIALNESEPTE